MFKVKKRHTGYRERYKTKFLVDYTDYPKKIFFKKVIKQVTLTGS